MSCLNAYKDAPEGDRSKLLNYFIEKRLSNLTESIGEFLMTPLLSEVLESVAKVQKPKIKKLLYLGSMIVKD